MSTALQESEETALAIPSDLHITKAPKEVLEGARLAAVALKEVIANKKRPVVFNGEQYLQYEDWQTIGGFFGCSVATGDAELVSIDSVPGFKAKARVIDSNGIELSTAEAYCMKDEVNWKAKPYFQLASMAQTRAGAKALRNKFAWVAVLAGYNPTPAEEIGDPSQSEAARDAVPPCPECNGQMWDNRATKKGRQPDFKCKDKACNKAVWLDNAKSEVTSDKTPDEALRGELFDQAERLLIAMGKPEEKRKIALGRLVALPTDQMQIKVNELADSASHTRTTSKLDEKKVGMLNKIRSEFKAEEIQETLDKHWRSVPLESLSFDALEQLYADLIPF